MPDIVPHSREPATNNPNGSRAVFDKPIGGPTLDLPPMLLCLLWQRYLERVDPLIKLFHTPSAQKTFMETVANRENSSLSALCLVHAVSYAAIMSLSPAECDAELQDTKDVLLTRSRNSMDLSLNAIGILNTRDIMALQALTLYLICGRLDNDGPDVHRSVGMVIGIALKMNLNRDGYALGLKPFETEIRRRLWWNILSLDALTAQDHKTDPCALGKSFNTKVPSNVNDSELDPNMSSPPVTQRQTSEMIFSSARIEITFYSRQFVFSDQFCRENSYPELSAAEKRGALEMMKSRVESEYLQFYDENISLHSVAASAIRLILLKLKLSISESNSHGLSSINRGDLTQDWESYFTQVDALKTCHKGQQFLWFFTDVLKFSSEA
ncbi:hypothetical protein PISL3812_03976 [Talaromyces islandicus]|uniref:Xylanolytic transcriptional activator regulatory domain-containing protein n=1 Tax=Talaromyces islandicus TaxID=28573 RepID=A0A0U1LU80_TALIS|nr:hypothetical protein PISL3812_03976 [Talaromyces islandicus]